MQSMLNISATHGLPLCLSGIIHPLPLSHQISDHDRMRKAMIMMRKQRSLRRGGVNINIHANQEIMATQINFVEAVKGDDGDLNDILFDLYHAARAA